LHHRLLKIAYARIKRVSDMATMEHQRRVALTLLASNDSVNRADDAGAAIVPGGELWQSHKHYRYQGKRDARKTAEKRANEMTDLPKPVRASLDAFNESYRRQAERAVAALNAERADHAALIRAATSFVEEAERMGWGKTSETALPGSWDDLKMAVKRTRVRGRP
jgi:hypothetical protein